MGEDDQISSDLEFNFFGCNKSGWDRKVTHHKGDEKRGTLFSSFLEKLGLGPFTNSQQQQWSACKTLCFVCHSKIIPGKTLGSVQECPLLPHKWMRGGRYRRAHTASSVRANKTNCRSSKRWKQGLKHVLCSWRKWLTLCFASRLNSFWNQPFGKSKLVKESGMSQPVSDHFGGVEEQDPSLPPASLAHTFYTHVISHNSGQEHEHQGLGRQSKSPIILGSIKCLESCISSSYFIFRTHRSNKGLRAEIEAVSCGKESGLL